MRLRQTSEASLFSCSVHRLFNERRPQSVVICASRSTDKHHHKKATHMTRCPICGSEAEAIDQGTFDGSAFRCSTHGEVEVTDSALHEEHDRENGNAPSG